MIEIKEVCKQDYKKAQKFAIQGMHLDWYMDSKVILDLYAKYFWYMELNRATKVYGAYADDIFVGVLLAEIKNEPKRYYSVSKAIYEEILNAGLDLVDATCPFVRKIHKIAMIMDTKRKR